MKFTVTLKDPDGVYDSIQEAIKRSVEHIPAIGEDEREELIEIRSEKIRDITSKWFEYDEYLTVEIDTEEETIKVCEA